LAVCLACAHIVMNGADTNPARWRESLEGGDRSRRLGKYAESRQSYLQALAEAEKFGPDDRRLAATLNNLAALLFDYGDYAQAEPLFRRALGIFERLASPGDADTANVLNNLAALVARDGRLDDAQGMYERALAILAKRSPDAPESGAILNNLADVARRQGRDAEAAELYRRSVAAWKKQGAEGQAALPMGNLASLYFVSGRYDEAQQLLEQCLEAQIRLLGPDHPRMANNMAHLGEIYGFHSRYT